MNPEGKITVYLDQNVLSHLREGEAAQEALGCIVEGLCQQGVVFVYSRVHVEECRAFYDPIQYVRVLNRIRARYISPTSSLEGEPELIPDVADDLILDTEDFLDRCASLLSNLMLIVQFGLGWLGDLDAAVLRSELEDEVDRFIEVVSRETDGLADVKKMREQLISSLNTIDLSKIRLEGANFSLTEEQWNERYSQLDRLAEDRIFDYILGQIDGKEAKRLVSDFPKNFSRKGNSCEYGKLTGFALLLFCQGVGRDPRVKKKGQDERRKRFLAQLRDCQHIEEAARFDCFVSNDARAVKLAEAVYAHAGVKTHVFGVA